MVRFGLKSMTCDVFYVIVFKSVRFHLSTLGTKRFQNDGFLKVSTFETRFQKVPFSNENALVWMGA